MLRVLCEPEFPDAQYRIRYQRYASAPPLPGSGLGPDKTLWKLAESVLVVSAPAEPGPVEPPLADSAPADPLPVEPPFVEPAPADPVPVESLLAEPAPADPLPVETTLAEPASVDPVPAELALQPQIHRLSAKPGHFHPALPRLRRSSPAERSVHPCQTFCRSRHLEAEPHPLHPAAIAETAAASAAGSAPDSRRLPPASFQQLLRKGAPSRQVAATQPENPLRPRRHRRHVPAPHRGAQTFARSRYQAYSSLSPPFLQFSEGVTPLTSHPSPPTRPAKNRKLSNPPPFRAPSPPGSCRRIWLASPPGSKPPDPFPGRR